MVEYPRLAYDFWGKRDEYDVHRNPTLWAALQPALQLVTRVLYTNPMFWRSIRDLRTRRKVDPRLDPRDPATQATPFLQKMIRLDEIKQPGDTGYAADRDACWQELDDLAAAGFDYTYHVDRLLLERLELGIGPGFIDEEGKPAGFVYGRTSLLMAGPDSKIRVNISAELVWALLVPMYSSSEKLCASYIVATTLLHEIMHATCYAVDLMCMREHTLYDPKQDWQISNVLHDWWNTATDVDCGRGEPWWRDDLRCELGWAFEKEFWGDSAVALTGGSMQNRLSKHITTMPLAIMAERHHAANYVSSNDVLRGHYPVEDYYRPVPIDYYAKFFTDAFWQVEWPRHGFEAFKRLPPDRQNLCLMLPAWYPEKAMQDIFGSDNWRFFRVVIRSLRRYGHPLMAEYLNQIVWEVRGFHSLRNRWLIDMRTWQYPDAIWAELTGRLDGIADDVKRKWLVVSSPTDELYHECLAGKLSPHPNRQQWVQLMQNQFIDLTKDGGPYFTEIESMHRVAQDELRVMERMVYEFFTVRKGQRKFIYRPEADADPLIALLNRMINYKEKIDEHQSKLDDLQMCAILASETDRISTWCAWLDQDSQRLEHLSNLVLGEWQIDDDESKKLREAMNTVPSALYEKRAARVRKLAMKEYTGLDYRIREAVDEFYKKIESFVGKVMMPKSMLPEDFSQGMPTARQKVLALQKRLQNFGGDSLGKPLESISSNQSGNIFAYKNPSMKSAVDDPTRRFGATVGMSNTGATGGVSTKKQGNSGLAFGQSGYQVPALPRRTSGPKMATSANAFTKYGNLQSTLANTPAKFQGSFASQANVMAPPASSFGGMPFPTAGNPFGSTNAATMMQTPFPYPYADRNMTTSDLAYVTQNPTPAFQHLMTALQLPDETYRESENGDDSDMEM
ncbi:hypothetical protein PG994_013337 [Apiospora phragmitis]|uniref:Uncharacterized protein n=1 Tax=Apiospora phragmitis TaxID=2905665 RepID=A0ABR1T8B0_9PEZI